MNPILVALDFPDLAGAEAMAKDLVNEVGGFKVGLELVSGEGPRAIERIAALGLPVFADMKLHDIPNTVLGAARRISAAGARWVTVHASGGRGMMEAAVEGMGDGGVLAVSVLTSLSEEDLLSIGIDGDLSTQVVRLGRLGEAAGVEGMVCSPREVSAVRASGISLKVFTPGIRLAATSDDQKRTSGPADAVEAGADYLVVGRPITRSDNPVAVAREIAASLSATL